MNYFVLFLLPWFTLATEIPLAPLPVFLKSGFSTVLEFDAAPSQVVLGDKSSFQVEKLSQSIAIKPLSSYATTNMFVYFKARKTKLFILTASEEADPTYIRKIKTMPKKNPARIRVTKPTRTTQRGVRLLKAGFDKKKDYLTVDLKVSANSKGSIKPKWELARLVYKRAAIAPDKLWAERKTVQKDAKVKARFVFVRPNVPRSLRGAKIIIPIHGSQRALGVPLRLVKR